MATNTGYLATNYYRGFKIMSTFALTTGHSMTDIIGGLNYALSTIGTGGVADNVVISNPDTGIISNNTTGAVIGYLYRYLFVRYATSADGSTGFSSSPTNATYYGLRNIDTFSPSSNPADYIWYQVAGGGFGTTKTMFYSNTGGRQIQFVIGTTNPGGTYVATTTTIDLDNLTINLTQASSSFNPAFISVPMAGSPAAPVFTGINPKVGVSANNASVPFIAAQTDNDVTFTNGTWRIGQGATGGYSNIQLSGITIGNPSVSNTYFAQFPNPTAMSGNIGFINVPIRYKDGFGTVYQIPNTEIQIAQQTPGLAGYTITTTPNVVSVPQIFGGTYPTTTFWANCQVTNGVETLTKSQPFNVNTLGVVTYGTAIGSNAIVVTTTPTVVTFTHPSGSASSQIQIGTYANITFNTFQFRDQFLVFRYADTVNGGNITTNPDGKQFVGLFNSINPTAPGTASSYVWYDLGSPLSNINRLYVKNAYNRSLTIRLSNENPDTTVFRDMFDTTNPNPVIDLDARTGFLLTQAYTAGGSNFLTAVTNLDGTLTYLLPDGTSAPGLTPIASIAALNVDAQGRLTGFTATDKLYFGEAQIVADKANVIIDFTHIQGQILVYMNGLLLDASDYVEGPGTISANVRIPNSYNGAIIYLVRFSQSDSSGTISYVPFTRNTVTSVAGQQVYSINYTQSAELLYWNGVFMNDADYDYSAGPNTFKVLNTYPRGTGDIFTVISFRVLNNNTVPFGQAVGTTTAGSVSIPVTGTITTNYTMIMKNGITLADTDATASASAISLANSAIFTGQVVQSTSYAASPETSNLLSGTTPYTSGNVVVTPSISIGAMGALTSDPQVQLEARQALQSTMPQGFRVMNIGKTLNESDGTGFPRIEHPPTIGDMMNAQHKVAQAQIDHLEGLVHKLINHITSQSVVAMTPDLREVIQETRTGTH